MACTCAKLTTGTLVPIYMLHSTAEVDAGCLTGDKAAMQGHADGDVGQ